MLLQQFILSIANKILLYFVTAQFKIKELSMQ